MGLNDYEKIKIDFLSGKIKGCKNYFEKNHYYVEAGYCYIILDDLDKAEKLFKSVDENNPRATWGLFLLQLIRGNIKSSPTYFQVRNFLELDLNILLLYCKGDYVEKIIKYSDFLAYYNPESYKFIGRAFWANGFIPASLFFLRRAKDKFYQDPELHYLLGYIYFHEENDIEQSKKALRTCLELLPAYHPATKLLWTICNK